MAYSPIAFTAPNYRDYKNNWVKAYEPGTTTPKAMALESDGGTQVAKLEINKDGFLISAGAALVIPYIDGTYDLWMFPTEAEADINDTSNALRLADDVTAPLFESELSGLIDSQLINDLSQAYESETLMALTASSVLFPAEKIINTKGYASTTDGGQGKFKATGVTDLGEAGNIDIISGDAYNALGQQFKVQAINGRVTSASMGLIPDGVTDYFVNGMMDKWLQYLSTTDVTGVFTSSAPNGYYNCAIDQFYSNVSVYQEPGAVFAGTIHIAINDDINAPASNRPKHVRWMGEAASYVRVGSWNCDDIYIQRIAIYENAAKAQGGFRAGGVHFFGGSKDMYVGDCYIENSERSAALAVDYEPGQTSPENIHFDNIFIESSYVHGVSFVGENISFNKLVVKEYGMGNVGDPNINFALSQNPGGLIQAMGFSLGSFGSCSGGSLIVNQNPASPSGDGSAVNLFTDGTFECGKIDIDGSLAIGFQNNFTDATISKLQVKNSGSQGLFNKAKLTGSELLVESSVNNGIRNEQGGLIAYNSVTTKSNGEEGYDSGDGVVAIGRLLCENNNQTVHGYGCVFGTTASGSVNVINVKQTASGIGGGVEFNGVQQRVSIGSILITNATDNNGSQFAGISIFNSTGVSILSAVIDGDNGANSFQPLRIINPINVNLNGFRITNTFNGQIVAGTVSAIDNNGFMNCINDAGTNISPITVQEFNCVGMTA